MQPEAGCTPQCNIELMPKKEILYALNAVAFLVVGHGRRQLLWFAVTRQRPAGQHC
jgi:hypothetical protein